MQQFGFSATDVKLKQWDETQNSAATQTFSTDILWHADAFPIICQGILFITETFAQTAE